MNKLSLNNIANWRPSFQHMVTERHFIFKYKIEPILSKELFSTFAESFCNFSLLLVSCEGDETLRTDFS